MVPLRRVLGVVAVTAVFFYALGRWSAEPEPAQDPLLASEEPPLIEQPGEPTAEETAGAAGSARAASTPPEADEAAPVAAAPLPEVELPGVAAAPSAPAESQRAAQPEAAGQARATESAARADPGRRWVQLGAMRSVDRAQQEWSRLEAEHPDLLGSLSPTVARADLTQGTLYRLRVGPLPDRQTAVGLCESLSQRRVSCFVVTE